MATSVMGPANTISDMAKKKAADRHKTTRVNVGLPEKWHAVARRLAAKRQQPVTYLLIAMLKTEADKEGIADLPAPPWEEEEPEGG